MVASTCLENEIPLCSLNDIEEGHSIEMVIQDRPLFVVRKADNIYAYWNICPVGGRKKSHSETSRYMGTPACKRKAADGGGGKLEHGGAPFHLGAKTGFC